MLDNGEKFSITTSKGDCFKFSADETIGLGSLFAAAQGISLIGSSQIEFLTSKIIIPSSYNTVFVDEKGNTIINTIKSISLPVYKQVEEYQSYKYVDIEKNIKAQIQSNQISFYLSNSYFKLDSDYYEASCLYFPIPEDFLNTTMTYLVKTITPNTGTSSPQAKYEYYTYGGLINSIDYPDGPKNLVPIWSVDNTTDNSVYFITITCIDQNNINK